jgi:hypothetical protein
MFTIVALWINASHISVHADVFCTKSLNVRRTRKVQMSTSTHHLTTFNIKIFHLFRYSFYYLINEPKILIVILEHL